MPQTKQKPAATKADRKPKAERRYSCKLPQDAAEAIRGSLRERLQELMDDFQKNAWPEELRLMFEILENWDNTGGGSHHERTNFAPPLHSAVVDAIDSHSNHLINVPSEKMVGPVEDFIASLEKEGVPERVPRSIPEIRKRRIEDIKDILEREFSKQASSEDLYFLEGVMSRWCEFMSAHELDRPQVPLPSAFQMELDREHWLVQVSSYEAAQAGNLVKILTTRNSWLAPLLNWIGEQGVDNLSPCLIASKAAGMQEAWDKAREAAAA